MLSGDCECTMTPLLSLAQGGASAGAAGDVVFQAQDVVSVRLVGIQVAEMASKFSQWS